MANFHLTEEEISALAQVLRQLSPEELEAYELDSASIEAVLNIYLGIVRRWQKEAYLEWLGDLASDASLMKEENK